MNGCFGHEPLLKAKVLVLCVRVCVCLYRERKSERDQKCQGQICVPVQSSPVQCSPVLHYVLSFVINVAKTVKIDTIPE